jgi:L-rhamnose mutarotase
MTLNLVNDADKIAKYKKYHQAVWPEVERSLKSIGITKMKIFLKGRRLFMYMETVDNFKPERDFPKYLENDPKCKEWDSLMCTFQEKVPEAAEKEWWSTMDEVYNLA